MSSSLFLSLRFEIAYIFQLMLFNFFESQVMKLSYFIELLWMQGLRYEIIRAWMQVMIKEGNK